jgi:O-antigen/teichoic acid export membrane protein
MLLGVPFSLGLASAADGVVPVVLGPKWAETAPVIALLGFAMPFMTLQALFGPAVNAAGHPGIYTRISLFGGVLLPLCFLAGIHWGLAGLASAWLVGYPLLVALSAAWVLPALRLSVREFLKAFLPPLVAGAAMAVVVRLVDRALPPMPALAHLALLVAVGGAVYGLWLLTLARARLTELVDLARRRRG